MMSAEPRWTSDCLEIEPFDAATAAVELGEVLGSGRCGRAPATCPAARPPGGPRGRSGPTGRRRSGSQRVLQGPALVEHRTEARLIVVPVIVAAMAVPVCPHGTDRGATGYHSVTAPLTASTRPAERCDHPPAGRQYPRGAAPDVAGALSRRVLPSATAGKPDRTPLRTDAALREGCGPGRTSGPLWSVPDGRREWAFGRDIGVVNPSVRGRGRRLS